MLILTKEYYYTIYEEEPLCFKGHVVIKDSRIQSVYGPILYNNQLIGILLQDFPYYKLYKEEHSQIVLEFIDKIHQELKNLGYAIEL